jgi:sugar phosphate isomerase/epimerase
MRTEPINLTFLIKNIWFLIRTLPIAAKKADYHYNRAIEVSGEIGAKCITGISLLELGLLQKHKGRKEEAQNSIAVAIKYFEECGAYAHLKRAKEAMNSL